MSSFTLKANQTGALALELNDAAPWRVSPEPKLPTMVPDEDYTESYDVEGARRVRSHETNPEGSIALQVEGQSGSNAAFWGALTALQQTVELCRRHGGTLRYLPDAGGVAVTYELESIWLAELPQDFQIANRFARAQLDFIARPFGLLDPIALVTNVTSAAPVQTVDLPDIPGSADARVAVKLTDLAGQNRDYVEAGIDDAYDGAAPAFIDSASMTALGGASTASGSAYGGSVMRMTLGGSPLAVCEKSGLGLKGQHRVKLRLIGNSVTGELYVRVAHRIAGGRWRRGGFVTVPVNGAYMDLDLGVVRGEEGGTLTVRVEAYTSAPSAASTIDVDYLTLIPAVRRTRLEAVKDWDAVTTYALRDRFEQTAGNLAGKVPTTGGAWAGSIDADDFTIDTAGDRAQRTAVSDASVTAGRAAFLPTVFTDLIAECDYTFNSAYAAALQGVLFRYVDANNWLVAGIEQGPLGGSLTIKGLIAGAAVTLYGGVIQSGFYAVSNALYRTRIKVTAEGEFELSIGVGAGKFNPAGSGSSPHLATGGALASGKVGIYDSRATFTAATRTFSNFAAYAPEVQRACLSGAGVTIDHESAKRDDGGSPIPTGNYLTCPPAGREDRVHRLVARMRRANIASAPDTSIADNQRIDVTVTPRVALL